MESEPGSLAKLLESILNSFIDLIGCDAGSIFALRPVAEGEPVLAFEAMITRSIKLRRVPDHLKNLRFKVDDTTLVGRTATHRKSHRISYTQEEGKTSPQVDRILNYSTQSILSAPLITPRGDLVGVVQLLNKVTNKESGEIGNFTDRDERLFMIIAGQAALAMENSMLLEAQEKLMEGFVNACVTAVEARDPVTSGHSTRVASFTVSLAEAVNRTDSGLLKSTRFSPTQIREIRYAAMLHDIGKISVKEQVLNKEKKLLPWELEIIRMRLKLMRAELRLKEQLNGARDKKLMEMIEGAWKIIANANEPTILPAEAGAILHELHAVQFSSVDGQTLAALTERERIKLSILKGSLTADERHEIEQHVTHSYGILKMVPWSRGLEFVPEIAYKHHEKIDGSGYPRGIQGGDIPIQARMLTICDIFDALSADDRPYKRSVPLETALDILAAEVREEKLDPDLFEIFLKARIFEQAERYRPTKKAA